ncbi:hypothetical protein PsorP6_000500 [Peronosclerospora sorghi]|uniref:Uncharacterized protein n=1 Tax=Peronosclerospora sorghi TaxID=230839 RepID=A0ACC0WWE6_9STRA|nr:hypothetical protein PsorP6_000500 [Peronosclerospora sorghi]
MSTVICHFERLGCNHPILFQNEYKRTNRTKKTKILRCFPHCCPRHIIRSYCGSALYVSVKLVEPSDQDEKKQQVTATVTTTNPSTLLVYAHFEEAQANFLSLNDLLDYAIVTSSTQTEQTPKGTWIKGFALKSDATDDSSMFQINPSARWYYEWESAATKAQRFTKHALRVYVFQRMQSKLRVVGVISSSDFMVVSYRRAPSEIRADCDALEALSTTAANIQPSDAALELKPNNSIRSGCVTNSWTMTGNGDERWRSYKLWECRHTDVMTTSKHLGILYYFLRHLNALSFINCLNQISVLFRDQIAGYYDVTRTKWKEDNDLELPFGPPLSWAFLEPFGREESIKSRFDEREGADDGPLAPLVHICTHLAGWLMLDSANLKIYRRFLRSYGTTLLDKNRVRAGYVEAIILVSNLVDHFTGWDEDPSPVSVTSLSLLCEEILMVVFQYDHLKPLRSILLDVLSSSTMFGMHEFVAQLQAQFLFQNSNSHLPRKAIGHTSMFDGAWVFDGQASSIRPIPGSPTKDASLMCVLTFMRELTRINVRLLDDLSLEIRSDWNVSTENTRKSEHIHSGTVLILDSCQRVFRCFPSGISSLAPLGTRSYGDYRGKLLSSNSFELEINSWPLDSSGSSPAHCWKIQVDVELADQVQRKQGIPMCLVVRSVVEEGIWRQSYNSQDVAFQAIPFSPKQKLVEMWVPTYELTGVYHRVD